jgi:uncharacterized membrane protein YfcA
VNANVLALVTVGVAAGGLGALLGVGGGIILVPGLILLAGLPFHSAVAASLVCVVATSVSGSVVYLRRGRVELDVAVRLQLFTVVGAVAAGLVATAIPAAPLYLAFALLVAGLLGVGGGILNVPILHLLLGRSFDRAAATSVYMIGVTAAAAAAVYLVRGAVEPTIAGVTMLGTLAGAAVAAALGERLDRRLLKVAFVLLLLYVAVRMVSLGVAAL